MKQLLMNDETLARRLAFLIEVDRLKYVLRRATLPGAGRHENTAEHSWHLAVAALVLADYAAEPVDMARVVQMALVHDIVEIDAGDTFFFDATAALDKAEREERAAERIFGLLPADQAADLRAAWEEFERRETAEARLAAALDRFMPLLVNYLSAGRTWRDNAITSDRVLGIADHIEPGAPAIAELARALVAEAVAAGYFDAQEPVGSAHAA